MEPFYTPKDYGTAVYLIHSCMYGGHLLVDCAKTEEEANEKIQMYESLSKGTTKYVYFLNRKS